MHELLRRETRAVHLALHAQPLLARLAQSDLAIAEYRRVLMAFMAVYQWLEPALEAGLRHHRIGFDYVPRRKLPWLLDDIAAVGPGDDGATHVVDARPFALDHPGAVVGALYVVEGSTLGARQLTEWAQRIDGLSVGHGVRFFHGYGVDRGANWAAFIAFLNSLTPSPAFGRHAVDAALAVFNSVHQSLDRHA